MNISEKDFRIICIINAIFIIIMVIIWFLIGDLIFPEGREFEAEMFQSVIMVIVASIGLVFLWYLVYIYKLSTTSGKVWFLLGLGITIGIMGDIAYTYYELFTEEAPFPNIAYFFYLMSYLPLFIGLLLQIRLIEIELPSLDRVIIVISYIIICIIVIVLVIIIPIQRAYPIPEEEVLKYFIGALYLIFDLILLICVMVLFAKLRGGKLNIALILLLIGFIFIIIADILFYWMENVVKETTTFDFYDLLFIIGFIFIYISALSVISLMTKTFEES